MNTRRSTARREEGCVPIKRIPPRVDQVPIVGPEEDNEEVTLQDSQVPLKPQEPQVLEVPPILKIFLLKDICLMWSLGLP